jgi:hypothetical protein
MSSLSKDTSVYSSSFCAYPESPIYWICATLLHFQIASIKIRASAQRVVVFLKVTNDEQKIILATFFFLSGDDFIFYGIRFMFNYNDNIKYHAGEYTKDKLCSLGHVKNQLTIIFTLSFMSITEKIYESGCFRDITENTLLILINYAYFDFINK